MWGFDKTKTSLDDLIEFFEEGFENVVNIRQRTIPGSKDLEVSRQFLLLHVLIEIFTLSIVGTRIHWLCICNFQNPQRC